MAGVSCVRVTRSPTQQHIPIEQICFRDYAGNVRLSLPPENSLVRSQMMNK